MDLTHENGTPLGETDHDKLLVHTGEIRRLWDRFAAEKEALNLASGQWPTREETAKMISALREDLTQSALPRAVYDTAHKELEHKVESVQGSLSLFLPREVFESTQKEVILKAEALATAVAGKPSSEQHEALDERVKKMEIGKNDITSFDAQNVRVNDRLQQLEGFKNRAMGFGALVALISGAIGAVIAKALGG